MALFDRREFIAASTGLFLVSFGGFVPARAAGPTAFGAWLRIGADNTTIVEMSQSEMGQGISTTLPLLLLDELGGDPARLRTEWSPFDPAYRHPQYGWMFTGNSESSSTFAGIMRTMGAAAREMLVQAAATRLAVAPATLVVANGFITDPISGTRVRFADVAQAAAALPVPASPKLKAPGELLFAGKPQPRRDIPAKVDGSAIFGIDVQVPRMVVGAIRRSAAAGAPLVHYDEARIRAHRGVVAVVPIPNGLCVVADRYWTAKRALDDGALRFGASPMPDYSTVAQRAADRATLAGGTFDVKGSAGDAKAAFVAAAPIEAVYEIPAQAHATMEPMNCTAHVTPDRCELWVPTQGVEITHGVAMQLTGLRADQIVINRTLLGGGFGRRLLADFARIAITVARQVRLPVKVIWSREEDFANDAFRPPMTHSIRAVLGPSGLPVAMQHRVVSPSHLRYVFPRPAIKAEPPWDRAIDPPVAYDFMAVEGVAEPPYAIANYLVEQHRVATPLQVSVWRTTGHGPNNFALESFIDELAHTAGRDPLAYRLALASADARAVAVLNAVASDAQWSRPRPAGHAVGIALAKAFGGYIAQVIEISRHAKRVHVDHVWSVVDVGQTLDPGIAAANVEGGIVWGLSALRTEATFAGGAVRETNFDRFDPVHMWETPRISTRFIESGAKIGGTGELGPVPTHAAFGNAVFAATGTRIRALPIARHGFTLA